MIRIILLGLPGAGKGAQGYRLARRLGVSHLSLGDYVRDQVAQKTELGSELHRLFQASSGWSPLPDALAIKVVEQMVKECPNWILDGFPRTTIQAESASFLEPISAVIFLNVNESVARERVLSRGRDGDSIEKFERRLAAERERLPDLIAYARSHWRLLDIDADWSPDQIEASIIQELGLPSEDSRG